MSSDDWFREFEKQVAEHPELSDEENSDRATEGLKDVYADQVDQAKDLRKYGE